MTPISDALDAGIRRFRIDIDSSIPTGIRMSYADADVLRGELPMIERLTFTPRFQGVEIHTDAAAEDGVATIFTNGRSLEWRLW